MLKVRKSFGRRIWECLPILTSLTILLFPILASFRWPRVTAIFIVIYIFLWFLLALEYGALLLVAFHKVNKSKKMDWEQKLQNLHEGKNLNRKEENLRALLISRNDWISPHEVRHLVIIATCGEELHILRESLLSIVEADFDPGKIYVCLATEERKKESGRRNAELLQKEFGDVFKRFFWTEHPDNTPGEIRGKGGNITHAGKEVTRLLQNEKEDIAKVIVTTLDADNKVSRKYFSALTYSFCLQLNRQQKSYQPIPLFYNNIWDVPTLNRMLAIGSGFWYMINSRKPEYLRNFACHAQPLQALRAMDFWAVDTIVEDGHQFWRSYLHFRGDYAVVPLPVAIYQDAVLSHTYYRSITGQYKQVRRWAWGCSDIPFCASKFWKYRHELPRWKTFFQFSQLFQGHIMWATTALFITLSAPLAQILSPYFRETIVASHTEYLLRFFFYIALFGILTSTFVALLTLPPAPSTWKRFSLVWQWLLLPIATIFMGSFPALEAQSRLALGKPLEFQVTKKVRLPRSAFTKA